MSFDVDIKNNIKSFDAFVKNAGIQDRVDAIDKKIIENNKEIFKIIILYALRSISWTSAAYSVDKILNVFESDLVNYIEYIHRNIKDRGHHIPLIMLNNYNDDIENKKSITDDPNYNKDTKNRMITLYDTLRFCVDFYGEKKDDKKKIFMNVWNDIKNKKHDIGRNLLCASINKKTGLYTKKRGFLSKLFWIFVIIFVVLWFIVIFINYLLIIIIKTKNKTIKIKNYYIWLAWVPFYNIYILKKLYDIIILI